MMMHVHAVMRDVVQAPAVVELPSDLGDDDEGGGGGGGEDEVAAYGGRPVRSARTEQAKARLLKQQAKRNASLAGLGAAGSRLTQVMCPRAGVLLVQQMGLYVADATWLRQAVLIALPRAHRSSTGSRLRVVTRRVRTAWWCWTSVIEPRTC